MAVPYVVVIGASAGGIPALLQIVRGLPARFPAAVCVVMHTAPLAESRLPEVLSRAGSLPAKHAVSGETIAPEQIYVAPPDHHVLVRPGVLEVTRGPRENRSRPAIDPLFRSAARSYGSRVIGVILSGALHDGAAGLLAIEARGGATIVQDPADAAIAGMPLSALRMVDADHVLPAEEIAGVLARLVLERGVRTTVGAVMADEERIERTIDVDFLEQGNDTREGEPSVYTCPDCGGTLWQDGLSERLWFRCHVGHAYAPEVLLGQKSEELEAALWTSARLLRERATLSRQLAVGRANSVRSPELTARLNEQVALDERYAERIRELIETLPTPGEMVTVAARNTALVPSLGGSE
jgi:two-component system chemotaxis response regulator CheB